MSRLGSACNVIYSQDGKETDGMSNKDFLEVSLITKILSKFGYGLGSEQVFAANHVSQAYNLWCHV